MSTRNRGPPEPWLRSKTLLERFPLRGYSEVGKASRGEDFVMVVELSWIISDTDIREAKCCVCRGKFTREFVEAHLVSDSDRLHLGEVCPECLHRGAEYIERRTLKNLEFSTMLSESQLYMERRALTETLEVCPSPEEYEMLKAGVGGPRYATMEEANAAWKRGEW